jgi:MFS family permease
MEVTVMSLSPKEQQALASMEEGLAGSDPKLASLLATFARLASDEEMPVREKIRASRHRATRRPHRNQSQSQRRGNARRDRTRTGAYLSYGGVGIFIFGMFFFLTVFMQAVWGYSALKTGVAYLPFTAALLIASGAVTQLVPRIGARPLLLAGSAAAAGGLYWLSRISEHDTYTSGVLGPTMIIGAGTALLFVTLSLVALNRVPEADSGVASSLLNTGQQVGGSVGLALLGTVAWTVVAHSIHAQAAVAARAGHPAHPGGPLAAAIYKHALATGFARGFLVAAAIALLTLVINIAAIRVRRADLAGAPQPVPAAPAEPTQPVSAAPADPTQPR